MQAAPDAGDVRRLYAHGGIEVMPLSQAIGAEIRGLDLTQDPGPATWTAIHHAWLEHSVLLFRDQRLSDADLVRFSRHFGDLDPSPRMGWRVDEEGTLPEIFVISNVVKHGRPIGYLGDGELDWHTDMSHAAIPSKASTLYALEIPADGSGCTGFMNMYLVLEALPEPLRHQAAQHGMSMTLRTRSKVSCARGFVLKTGMTSSQHLVPYTSWCARIGKRAVKPCTLDASGMDHGAAAMCRGCRGRDPKRSRTRSGTSYGPNSLSGITTGVSGTICCGTTAASCTAASL